MNDLLWWQRALIYQVYPRSFRDANGDGVGDLTGISQKLEYLKWLGADAVWLSPIFRSPMVDHGYDISDYTDIDPAFGTLRDFDELLARAHALGLRVILDLVPNHSSDQHPWFVQARSSRDNPKRDFYLWRDAAPGGGVPNNWISNFGGPAWEWDERTGQYYYHAFHKAQPDLNWRNPDVQAAMLDVVRFWFDRGVDGFRIDVLWHLIKDADFRDNPRNPSFRPGQPPHHAVLQTYSTDRPEVFDIVKKLRSVADEYPDRLLIGEIYLPIDRLVAYYGEHGDGVHLPFNFQLVTEPWDARAIARCIEAYEAALPPGAWPNWVLGNHDQPRVASRTSAAQARVAAMLLLTLRGTLTLYYGEEIGMHDVEVPEALRHDPQSRGMPGIGMERDFYRTPMQWSVEPAAGFSATEPWLPVADDFRLNNVEVERDAPGSMLTLHRRLIELRRREPALVAGKCRIVPADGGVLAYLREHGARRLLVALNLTSKPAVLRAGYLVAHGRVVLGTDRARDGAAVERDVELAADEGLVIELD